MYVYVSTDIMFIHTGNRVDMKRVFIDSIFSHQPIYPLRILYFLYVSTDVTCYGVAMISRLLTIIGLFCKRAL